MGIFIVRGPDIVREGELADLADPMIGAELTADDELMAQRALHVSQSILAFNFWRDDIDTTVAYEGVASVICPVNCNTGEAEEMELRWQTFGEQLVRRLGIIVEGETVCRLMGSPRLGAVARLSSHNHIPRVQEIVDDTYDDAYRVQGDNVSTELRKHHETADALVVCSPDASDNLLWRHKGNESSAVVYCPDPSSREFVGVPLV